MIEKNKANYGTFIAIATVFTLSCSDSNDNGGGEPNQGGNLCNSVGYDPSVYECKMGELIGSCKGKDYNVAYEQCVGGVVVELSSSSSIIQSSSSIVPSSSSLARSSSSSVLPSSSSSSSIECRSAIISNPSTCQNVRIGPPSEKECQMLAEANCCEDLVDYKERNPYWCGNADDIYANTGGSRYYMCCVYFD